MNIGTLSTFPLGHLPRFGCCVCTVVDKDRSIEAMIKNDDEKVWMTPLLDLRNDLGDFAKEKSRRDYRRMHGRVELFGRKDPNNLDIIRGPYTKAAREHWLRRVLEAQVEVRRLGPEEFQGSELISMSELQEIRSIWLYEKHEFDDSLPRIYEQVMGQPFPVPDSDDNVLRGEDWELLKELCGTDEEFFELQAGLLDIEREFVGMSRRAGIYDKLEDRVRAAQFRGEDEAYAIRRDEERRRREAMETGVEPTAMQRQLFEDEEELVEAGETE